MTRSARPTPDPTPGADHEPRENETKPGQLSPLLPALLLGTILTAALTALAYALGTLG